MGAISAFFMQNIVYVYFFYGLAFLGMGLVVLLESGRASEFRFARALVPLGLFGLLHGTHEWLEMFQIVAVHETGYVPGAAFELICAALLVTSLVFLLIFGTRLLPDADAHPRASRWQVLTMLGLWAAGVAFVAWRLRPSLTEVLVSADVLARYSLAIPGSLLAAWALLRERHDFHARGMSVYGRSLLWAALAFFIYGVIGQLFTRPSLVFPSQVINTAFFLRLFGMPIQMLRGLAAVGIAITLGSSLRAFEAESRIRLARANKARIEAQVEALEAQQRRTDEVEVLNAQLRVTASELSAMLALSHLLASTLDLDQMLHSALSRIVDSFERACCGLVMLRDPDGSLQPASQHCRMGAAPARLPPALYNVISQAIARGCVAAAAPDGVITFLEEDSPAPGQVFNALGVPLQTKTQMLGGVALAGATSDTPFGRQDLNLLRAFCRQITAALENARLYRVVQEREGQLEDLVRQLVSAQEGERQRIARELHDETGQKLSALVMGLAAVDSQLSSNGDDELPPCRARALELVRNLRELSDQAIIELRNIMADLRPALLDDLGLAPALRWYAQQYQGRYPEMVVSLSADRALPRLPSQVETVLFRAVQETLTNIARHARATAVTITLAREPDGVSLEIADDGVGFDPAAPSRHPAGSGMGMVGMRERVALVGGRCAVTSQPGAGTRVRLDLPVKWGEGAR